jgi:DNA-binding beta-propeller fold protein YncE
MNRIDAKAFIFVIALLTVAIPSLRAEKTKSFIETIRHHKTLISTIPDSGDLNPYAVIVAPVSAGRIQKDDVLITNFNGLTNLQGTGTTIVDYNPANKRLTTFARVPQHLPQCPGGIGLSTALVMLKSGWVIVGSAPSTDGTTRTLGAGCMLVFDSNGQLAATWANDKIRCPWGNMAWVDNGSTATLFVSMAGFDVPPLQVRDPATGYPVTVNKGTVLRIKLSIPEGKPPVVTEETVVANGFGQRADRDVFLIGPTGLVVAADGTTLYASDALGNQIVAIEDATTRTTSAGLGRTVSKDGLLRRPLAMTMAPNGNLLALNAKNGQVVEINPLTGEQLGAQWIDNNPAQSPPGNGDLFGLAIKPDGRGFYYVQDDVNTLVEATQ